MRCGCGMLFELVFECRHPIGQMKKIIVRFFPGKRLGNVVYFFHKIHRRVPYIRHSSSQIHHFHAFVFVFIEYKIRIRKFVVGIVVADVDFVFHPVFQREVYL